MQVLDNTPSSGCIQWSGCHITYLGTTYTITNGYTNYVYVYWLLSSPTSFVVSDTFPTLSDSDALVFLNKSGVHATVPNTTIIDGSLIVPESILANQIAANAVTTTKIAAGAITASLIAANTITSNKIAANAIGAAAIAANTITGDKLVADAITAREIASSTITANEIATNTITAASGIIADAAITNAKISNLDAGKITTGTLNADRIATNTITANKLASDVGNSLDISSNVSVTSKVSTADLGSQITQNADAVKIAVGQIGGNNLLKNSGFEMLSSNTISATHSVNEYMFGTIFNNTNAYDGTCLYFDNFNQVFPTDTYLHTNLGATLKAGKVCTCSYYYCFAGAVTDGSCYLTTDGYVQIIGINPIPPHVDQTWQRCSVTFTCPADGYYNVRFGFNAYDSAWMMVDDVQLEEGENATAWSPNANELKSNIVEITDDHLRATFNDGSYSEMVPAGFHHVSAGGTHSYMYLSYTNVASATLNGTTITLPAEFKGKDFKIMVSVKSASGGGDSITTVAVYADSYDIPNATFRLSGYTFDSALGQNSIDASYIAIA